MYGPICPLLRCEGDVRMFGRGVRTRGARGGEVGVSVSCSVVHDCFARGCGRNGVGHGGIGGEGGGVLSDSGWVRVSCAFGVHQRSRTVSFPRVSCVLLVQTLSRGSAEVGLNTSRRVRLNGLSLQSLLPLSRFLSRLDRNEENLSLTTAPRLADQGLS